MRRAWIGCLFAALTLPAVVVVAGEPATIFDQLHIADATAAAEGRRASDVERQVEALETQLDERWVVVDVAQRAAAPIRRDVTRGLARWLGAHRVAMREAMDAPHAAADTRRLLGYAAARALPSRLRDVDVVRRADAERASFDALMARRASWGVELARTHATAGAAGGARDVLIANARAGGAAGDLAATDEEFEKLLAEVKPVRGDVDFHRHKGTLARPMARNPDVAFGADAPLMRSTGWTYRPNLGDDVYAVHTGEVTFVGVVQGWGLVVVVDHGGGYTSAYGHLDETQVERGAQVERAQVIAAAGDTGSLDGERLYFELRHRNVPVDPAQWFLKR